MISPANGPSISAPVSEPPTGTSICQNFQSRTSYQSFTCLPTVQSAKFGTRSIIPKVLGEPMAKPLSRSGHILTSPLYQQGKWGLVQGILRWTTIGVVGIGGRFADLVSMVSCRVALPNAHPSARLQGRPLRRTSSKLWKWHWHSARWRMISPRRFPHER